MHSSFSCSVIGIMVLDSLTQPTAGSGGVPPPLGVVRSSGSSRVKPNRPIQDITHVLLYLRRGAHARAKQLEEKQSVNPNGDWIAKCVLLLYLRRSAHARAKQLEDIKGDHPWRTGGRPTQELANAISQSERD